MGIEANKQAVRAYFKALDTADEGALDALFTEDCVIHRPGLDPIVGLAGIRQIVRNAKTNYTSLASEIHDLIAEGERVACRLTHHAAMRASWTSRLGTHDVAGKRMTWHPLVIFEFRDGKIAGEWVSRDELGMAIQLGIVVSAS